MSIGKMRKHKEMFQRPVLRPFIPETYWFTPSRTLWMLRRYPSIFIKPDQGSEGTGIILVKRMGDEYEVRCGRNRKIVGADSLLVAIQSYWKPSERYLVQRGIRLAKYNGSIFDVRVYMQKPISKWIVAGMIARVAAPNQYVTNYHKGGHGETLPKVLSTLFANNRSKVNECLNRIRKLSLIIAETINQQYSIRELGIDFGIEKDGRIWIIEANSKPGHMLFAQHPNKTILQRIMRNKRLIQKYKA